jgi:diphthine-ammonia ligase
MSSSLNVIALISGGKDSLYSLLHCKAQGHTLVALANLHPPLRSDGTAPDESEDLDSFMYQTVGHTVVPLYEEALGIPLYRQEILGGARNQDRDYSAGATNADETESLIPLLKKVMENHPEANAINTGAILSTYQRTRVESVALRLGLTPLSYLWQYPFLPPYRESKLLEDMFHMGQDSRIIKVASGGLDQSFLWQNVGAFNIQNRLKNAVAQFSDGGDGAVLGEGGEYETLALDGPPALWKKKIEIDDDGVMLVDAGTAVFKGKNARVVEKGGRQRSFIDLHELPIPPMWDIEFRDLLEARSKPQTLQSLALAVPETIHSQASTPPASTFKFGQVSTTSTHVCYSNMAVPSQPSHPLNVSSQLQTILSNLKTDIHTRSLNPSAISHVTLLLRHISSFTVLNPVYSTLFTKPNPPSRVTVACGDAMPEGVDVMLSALLWTGSETEMAKRKGLHVQSRSYWAPANIGPYSQAIGIPIPTLQTPSSAEEEDDDEDTSTSNQPYIIHVAGQIPLLPATMQPFTSADFKSQTLLALQHLWRIARATHIQWWTAGLAFLSACPAGETAERVRIAQEAWLALHRLSLFPDLDEDECGEEGGDDEVEIDLWDVKNNRSGSGYARPFNDHIHRSAIPDPAAIPGSEENIHVPPCFVVQVDELPRSVDIEWHSTGLASCQISTPSSTILSVHNTNSRFVNWMIEEGSSVEEFMSELREMVKGEGRLEWEHATLYAAPGLNSEEWGEAVNRMQWVPCRRVWGREGKEVLGVVLGRITVISE